MELMDPVLVNRGRQQICTEFMKGPVHKLRAWGSGIGKFPKDQTLLSFRLTQNLDSPKTCQQLTKAGLGSRASGLGYLPKHECYLERKLQGAIGSFLVMTWVVSLPRL